MKILHAANLPRPSLGIINQLHWEDDAAKKLGISWDIFLKCYDEVLQQKDFIEKFPRIKRGGFLFKVVNWIAFNLSYYRLLNKKKNDYDIFILRHSVASPFQLWFILFCAKPVYLVHHTLEVPELSIGSGFSYKLLSILESLLGKFSIRCANGVIGVTPEIVNYELDRARVLIKPTIVYPNGIAFDHGPSGDDRKSIPELLFVAGVFSPWHGLDRVLAALDNYSADVILHLVGDLAPEDAARASRDARVRIHGRLSNAEISNLAESCWVGLSSFALDRQGMKEACTLKVREYLMMGIPVYAGHLDVFPKDFPFYENGEPCTSRMIDYANRCRKFTREQVSNDARPYIEKKKLLNNFYNELRAGNG